MITLRRPAAARATRGASTGARFDAQLAPTRPAAARSSSRARALVGLETDGARVTGAACAIRRRPATPDRGRRSSSAPTACDPTVARLLGVERPVRFPRRLGLVAHYAGHRGPRRSRRDARRRRLLRRARADAGRRAERRHGAADGWPHRRGRSASRPPSPDFPRSPGGSPGARRLTPIRGASPIGHRVADVAGPGWLLVGDAAGFVDPFTGEGIHRALRSARAAADGHASATATRHAPTARERRRAFAAKSALSWLVQGFLAAPPLLEHAVARLDERPGAALRLGSALGDCRPATDALVARARSSRCSRP